MQTVTLEILANLNRFFVPILPHLAEDIYSHTAEDIAKYLKSKKSGFFSDKATEEQKTIQLSNWPLVKPEFQNQELSDNWDYVLSVRDLANKSLEELRNNKTIAKSLEAKLKISVPEAKLELFNRLKEEIKAAFIVSEVEIDSGLELKVDALLLSGYKKCERCWKHFPEGELNSDHICNTCDTAIEEYLSSQ